MKTALITGCSSGIGLATALEFARNGIFTYASMRDTSKRQRLEDIAKRENLPIRIIRLDVIDTRSIEDSIGLIMSDKGKLDVLVNNAGFMVMGSFEDISIEELDLQWRTDFLGPIALMKKAIPIMRKQQADENGIRGNIINISSVAGKIPFAYASAYIASKFALEGISESVSDEVADKGIKISVIEPGVVKTKFLENTKTVINHDGPYAEVIKQWNEMANVLFDVAKNFPEDVAAKVLACLKDSSSPLRIPVGEDAELFIDMHDQNAKEPEKFKSWFEKEMENMFATLGKR